MLGLAQTNWEHVAERWGLPLVILIVVAVALRAVFKTYIGPYFQKQLERADKQADAVTTLLNSQLEKAERAQETLLKDFRGAIEENNRVSRRVADSLDELLKRK